MDIKQLDKVVAADEEGAVITIYQKNGDPYTAADGTPCTMTVVGSESKRYKDAKRQSAKRMLKKRRTTLEPEEVEENAIRQATAASKRHAVVEEPHTVNQDLRDCCRRLQPLLSVRFAMLWSHVPSP